jgi:hypothetical protein
VISDDSGLPRVTVVIPTRNRLRLLREAIESVERQSLSEWELVVVDDASEDDTPTWLEGQRNPRIRRVRLDEHSERSAARNRGLREARGETVLFGGGQRPSRQSGLPSDSMPAGNGSELPIRGSVLRGQSGRRFSPAGIAAPVRRSSGQTAFARPAGGRTSSRTGNSAKCGSGSRD